MTSYVWGGEDTQHFYSLTPDNVLNAIESLGVKTTGRVMQLNSMENRVYEIEVNLDQEPDNPSENFLILKFYRPGRWTKNQIQDEHDFIWDLLDQEIQAIAPIKYNGETIFTSEENLFFSIFPKKGGRAADEWNDGLLEQMGRLLARLHNIGDAKKSEHRIHLNVNTYGRQNLDYLLKNDIVPKEYRQSYESVVNQICDLSEPLFKGIHVQRVHGDCHHGNTILGATGPFLIDFDDMVNAPRVQDIWLITPGRDEYSLRQRDVLIDAYLGMADFDFKELKLIESLRALRIIHFTAWIANRYEDESFKRAFHSFNTHQYWEKEVFDLRQQVLHIQDAVDSLNYSY